MGHQRLGDIPKSQKWSTVVSAVGGGGGFGGFVATEDLATLTLDAASEGLDYAKNDPTLRHTFYLLTQLVLAAREPDWRERLAAHGIRLEEHSTLFDFTAELQEAIEDHALNSGGLSDIGQIAQQAACEAVSSLAAPKARTLFGEGSAELQDAVREFSTKAGFRRLGHEFFGGFMARFLNFYLSRLVPGETSGRFGGASGQTAFNQRLRAHCMQSAQIVRDFCGDWYSKTEFQQGITPDNTSGFMAVALDKLRAELQKQREGQ